MTILEQNTDTESGKKFRLIVRSAEAVRVIRDKLGDNAKVISVRQVGGEGLKRFISSPKLEVIAQIVDDTKAILSTDLMHLRQVKSLHRKVMKVIRKFKKRL